MAEHADEDIRHATELLESAVPDLLDERDRLAAENADLRAKFARYWSEVPRRWIEGGPTP